MRRLILLALLAAASAAASACAGKSLPYYNDRSLTPSWGDSATHRIGDFSLMDQGGRAVSARDTRGKVYVASFFYASCRQLCPRLRSQLARVASAFSADSNVLLLSHTIAPESDSVEVLRRYASENHLDGRRWRLLTGARSEIQRLAREAYFVELSDSGGKTTGRLLHTETFVLVDGSGHIRGVYDGSLPYDVSQLIEDVRTLRAE